MKLKIFGVFLSALLLTAGLAVADDAMLVAGTVDTWDGTKLVLTTDEGTKSFTFMDADEADFKVGDSVLVRADEAGDTDTVLALWEDVQVVAEEPTDRSYAVVGSVKISNPSQLILNTVSGERAFAVNPQKMYPPIPQAGDNIALVYRVEQGFNLEPKFVAVELVEVPGSISGMAVGSTGTVTYRDLPGPDSDYILNADADADMDADVEMTAEVDVDADMDVDAEMDVEMDAEVETTTRTSYQTTERRTTTRTLPQTASQLPLMGLIGIFALAGAFVIRRLY